MVSGQKIPTGIAILEELQSFQFELKNHSGLRSKTQTLIIILVQELALESLTIQKFQWLLQVGYNITQ